jgi:hypothetical protein
MKITREHIGTIVVQQTGSYMTRTFPAQRLPRLRLVVVVAINPADNCEDDIFVKPVTPNADGEWPGQWTEASTLSLLDEHLVPGFAPNDRVFWLDAYSRRTEGRVVVALLGTVIVQVGNQWHYFGDSILADGKELSTLNRLEVVR